MAIDTIPEHHVQMFDENIFMLAAQKESKLLSRGAVNIEDGIVGERKWIDRLGSTEMQQITSRFQDTPLDDITHDRRALDMADWGNALLVDNIDKLRMLYDPTNPYAVRQSQAGARRIDDDVIAAFDATVTTDKDGAGTEAFDATNFGVAVDFVESGTSADSNLTVAKIRRAKQILDENEIEEDGRFFLTSPAGINALLRDNEVTSADFNSVRALVMGTLDTYLGFKFIVSNRLDIDSNQVRDNFAFHRDWGLLGFRQRPQTNIDIRPDKMRNTQVLTTMSLGAVRVEQARVVRVLIDEDL